MIANNTALLKQYDTSKHTKIIFMPKKMCYKSICYQSDMKNKAVNSGLMCICYTLIQAIWVLSQKIGLCFRTLGRTASLHYGSK